MQKLQHNHLKKISKADLKFANKVVETGNATQAVQEVYGIEDPNYAGVKGHRLLRNDKITEIIEIKRKSLRQALIDKGITEDYLADKVNVLLSASNDEGKADYNAIDKGLKHATSIYGVIPEGDKPQTGNTYNFIFSPEVQSEVKEIEDRIKAKLLQRNDTH